MGSTNTKEATKEVTKEVVRKVYIESDEAKRAIELRKLETQLESLKTEVQTLKQHFTSDEVRHTIVSKDDVLLLQYKELDDTTKILMNIDTIFNGLPGMEFIVETAKKLIEAIRGTDELKEVVRWQSNKVVQSDADGKRSIGIEVHYKLKILEETKGGGMLGMRGGSKNTALLIAYKYFAHVMDKPPSEIPSLEDIKKIKFS